MNSSQEDIEAIWMHRALELARRAESQGEVPVGAVLIKDGVCIGEGWNQPIAARDPSAHAEIVALRQAAEKLGNYRLPGTILYSTLEPCPMCSGALIHARVCHLVFAAADPRCGAGGSVFQILDSDRLNHRIKITKGVLEDESRMLLQTFFQRKRGSRT